MYSAGAISRTKGRSNISDVGPGFGSTKLAAAITRGALTLAALSALLLIAARPAHAQTESVLHSFAHNGTDGSASFAGLAIDTKGNLYGTTYNGGANNSGMVFKVTPSGTETVLHSFGGAYGANPYFSGVVRDTAGNLYGTTTAGGANGFGTVFKLSPTGTETVLHSFAADGKDGSHPYARLAIDKTGNLYGTTPVGGANNFGTVFKVTPSGTETVLYSFKGGTDGCNPNNAGVVLGKNGVLYGTTSGCGANAVGTVFKLTPTGTETVLHSFANDGTDGFSPYAGLAIDTKGNLYGTTYFGGASGFGTVFKLTPTGTETVLHNFANDGKDGCHPENSGLVLDVTGNLYGTTTVGGASGLGTVFKLTPTGTETVLHSFANNGTDGFDPYAGLALDKAGILYGTTLEGGANGFGTVFKITQYPVSFSPESLTFSAQTVGTTSAPKTVTLFNNQSVALNITSIAASADYSAAPGGTKPCASAVAANSSCTFVVRFSPTKIGTIKGSVTVTDDAPTSPQAVALTGRGQ